MWSTETSVHCIYAYIWATILGIAFTWQMCRSINLSNQKSRVGLELLHIAAVIVIEWKRCSIDVYLNKMGALVERLTPNFIKGRWWQLWPWTLRYITFFTSLLKHLCLRPLWTQFAIMGESVSEMPPNLFSRSIFRFMINFKNWKFTPCILLAKIGRA